ncbi:MAG: hypothetical protein LBP89_04840 [Helicobacteraceae bacterium]|nr:hypothetical protein [Helicobacteraceae bacterium]
MINGWTYQEDKENFSLRIMPTMNWIEEPRKFGARRESGARARAGYDLYDDKGVKAIKPKGS